MPEYAYIMRVRELVCKYENSFKGRLTKFKENNSELFYL